jgi:hypothetical protein
MEFNPLIRATRIQNYTYGYKRSTIRTLFSLLFVPAPPENPYAAREHKFLTIVALLGIQIAIKTEAP